MPSSSIWHLNLGFHLQGLNLSCCKLTSPHDDPCRFQFMGGQAAGYAAADAVQVRPCHRTCPLSGTCSKAWVQTCGEFALLTTDSAGAATGQHDMGCAAVWRILSLFQAHLHPAGQHVGYVCGCGDASHELSWLTQQLTFAQSPISILHHAASGPGARLLLTGTEELIM